MSMQISATLCLWPLPQRPAIANTVILQYIVCARLHDLGNSARDCEKLDVNLLTQH